VCVAECPVGAIKLGSDDTAAIDEVECIRCGRCHDVCPEEAVRHDGERIPQEVAANLEWVRRLLKHFGEASERAAFIDRMVRFFNKQKKVTEQTLAAIEAAGDDPAHGIDAAIRSLAKPQDQERD
jgi:ferredoxin